MEFSHHAFLTRVIDEYSRIVEVASEGELLHRVERDHHITRAERQRSPITYRAQYGDLGHLNVLRSKSLASEWQSIERTINFGHDGSLAFAFCECMMDNYDQGNHLADAVDLYWIDEQGQEHLGWGYRAYADDSAEFMT